MSYSFRSHVPLLAAMAIVPQLMADPFYPFDSELPAARVEEQSNTATLIAWQLDNFFNEMPIEQLLAETSSTMGAYELPVAPITFATPDPVSYESTWIEYLRQNQIQFGLLEATATAPSGEPGTVAAVVVRNMTAWVAPPPPLVVAASAVSAEAPVPEVSSLVAMGIGAAMLGLSRLRFRSRN